MALTEAAAAACGSLMSATVCYPLDVVKTMEQTGRDLASGGGGALGGVLTVAREDGWRALYAGLGAEYVKTAVSSFCYYYCYSRLKVVMVGGRGKGAGSSADAGAGGGAAGQSPPPPPPPPAYWRLVAAGLLAGAATRCVVCPIGVVQTRVQSGGGSALAVLRDVVAKDPLALWSGIGVSMVLTTNPAITNAVFDTVSRLLGRAGDRKLSAGAVFATGALSKCVSTVATYPLILAKVRLQSGKYGSSLPRVLLEAWRAGGLRGSYVGLRAQLTKAVLAAALMFMFKARAEEAVRAALSTRRPR